MEPDQKPSLIWLSDINIHSGAYKDQGFMGQIRLNKYK